MRRLIEFPCGGETLVGTLDPAAGATGILIVSGGNELRMGAHRGMAMLAQQLAAAGVPALRYDRRGIGDSSGTNAGFEGSADDIAAAAAVFRSAGRVDRIVAFGNCDAASALALFHAKAGLDRLMLSNPWTDGGSDDMPQSAAIKARYAERLRDPAEWWRLLRGGVDLRKLVAGLAKLARSRSEDHDLMDRMALALRASAVPTTILLAARDNTAIAFRDAWRNCAHATGAEIATLDSASHSYAGAADKRWLFDQLIAGTRD